jgi:hypothetical protein
MRPNKYSKSVLAILTAMAMALPSAAADKPAAKDEKQPSEAEMMAMMMELAKPGENHKLLAQGVGTWTYTAKMWMNPDPSAAPSESTGTAVTKEVLGGRYFITEHTGKMPMPGPDGKITEMEFKGMATDAYDNVKKKFLSTWIDNMGTTIMVSEGTYDPASKTFTYHTECEMMPGTKTKIREVIKIVDKDHHVFEFFEDRGGTEVRTMEIKYARKK